MSDVRVNAGKVMVFKILKVLAFCLFNISHSFLLLISVNQNVKTYRFHFSTFMFNKFVVSPTKYFHESFKITKYS